MYIQIDNKAINITCYNGIRSLYNSLVVEIKDTEYVAVINCKDFHECNIYFNLFNIHKVICTLLLT